METKNKKTTTGRGEAYSEGKSTIRAQRNDG